MSFDMDSTRSLLGVIEQTHVPTTLLVDTFFGREVTYPTEYVEMDYKKGGRRMAPFIVSGSKGVNMGREGFTTRDYKAPMMAPKMTLTPEILKKRMAGETVYSTRTPQQRAEEYRAKDLADMIAMCTRRQEWMAAQALCYGAFDVKGYADDGKLQQTDKVTFDGFTNKLTLSGTDMWTNEGSDALGTMQTMSRTIRRLATKIPSIGICSEATGNVLLKNKSLNNMMLIPSRDNLAMVQFAPRLTSPEVARLGMVTSLNLEIYTYDAIYEEDGDTISEWFYGSMNSFRLNDNFYTRGRNYVREYTTNDFNVFSEEEDGLEDLFENLGHSKDITIINNN